MKDLLERVSCLLCFWKPLPVAMTQDIWMQGQVGLLDDRAIYLYRGDKLTLHHPVSLLERILARVHGITLEIH